ncbi:MAG: HIRAN domain-containing protein [Bacteroidaceae bacterium]|nr:HIRAN domain-containing protein [Bacteroidaceae bacterium]
MKKEITITGIRYCVGHEGLTKAERDKHTEDFIRENLPVGTRVYLTRQPDNPHDPLAIAVRMADGKQIGYVGEAIAHSIHGCIDEGNLHVATVTKWDGHVTLRASLEIDETRVEPLVAKPKLTSNPFAVGIVVERSEEEQRADFLGKMLAYGADIEPSEIEGILASVATYLPLIGLSICQEDEISLNRLLSRLSSAAENSEISTGDRQRLTEAISSVSDKIGDLKTPESRLATFKRQIHRITENKAPMFNRFGQVYFGCPIEKGSRQNIREERRRIADWLNDHSQWFHATMDENQIISQLVYGGYARTDVYIIMCAMIIEQCLLINTQADDAFIKELAELCTDKERAEEFAIQLINAPDKLKPKVAAQFFYEGVTDIDNLKTPLYNLLQQYRLYEPTLQNWTNRVNAALKTLH